MEKDSTIIKKTKVYEGYGDVLRKQLDQYIQSVEDKELTYEDLDRANDEFRRSFDLISSRVLKGSAIKDAIGKVTESEVKATGELTEIKFGDQSLASQMLMVAFD